MLDLTQVLLDTELRKCARKGITYEDVKKAYIKAALSVSSGNQSKAARLIGVARGTIRAYDKG